MRTQRTCWTLVALAALVACQPAGPPQIVSLTADPPAISAGGSSTLRWLVSGADALTLAPGVGDVSGTSSAVVTPATTTTYTLTASGAGGTVSDDVTVTVDTALDLIGQVIGLDGRPAPGVLVSVLGAGTTTTGVDGGFALADVEPPYTIHVRHPTEPGVVTYVDLTIDDPVLIVAGTPTAAANTTFFTGTVSGGANFPQPASHVTRVTLASPAVRRTVDADGATGAFRIPLASAMPPVIEWYGADVPAALHALQWRFDAGFLPVDYVGHGTRAFDLRGFIAAYLDQDMALLPVAEGAVSGTMTVPAGYTLGARTMDVVYAEGGVVTPVAEWFPAASFSYVTPEIAGATLAIAGLAGAPGGELSYVIRTGLPATASGVNLVLPEVPQLTAPAEGTANVGYATSLTWTAAPGGVSIVLVAGPPGTLGHAVVTDGTSATIPDLRDLGLDLVPAGAYTWQVMHLPLYPSVDAAATNTDGLLSSWPLNAFYRPLADGAWANSLARTFTTVP